MIVESDVKMQDTLREQFKRNGYRVLVSATPTACCPASSTTARRRI